MTKRLRGGVLMLMVALGGAIAFEAIEAPPLLRLALFVPFFAAEYAFFQAIFRTCGVAAIRGLRFTTEGSEKIADPRERDACRCAGKTQIVHSVFAATVLTSLFVWLAY